MGDLAKESRIAFDGAASEICCRQELIRTSQKRESSISASFDNLVY